MGVFMYCGSIYPQRIQNTMFDNDNVVFVFMNSGIISPNNAEYSIYWQYVVFLCKVLKSPPKNIEYTSHWQYVVLSLCIVVQSPQSQHKDIASMPETLQIYKHTHKSISLYLLRFLSFFPQKNFQKNICTGNIFSTRQMSSSSNTKSKKDLFFLVHLSNWCTWNCSGRGRGNPT